MLVRTFLIFAALSISSPMAANAAGQSAEGVIGGSWAQSCDGPNSSVDGVTLQANCRDPGGTFHASALNLSTCGQPPAAGNQNGQLICESGPRHPPVSGSWWQSCFNEKFEGSILHASCFNRSGGAAETEIAVGTCAKPVAVGNSDGKLVCESGLRTRTIGNDATVPTDQSLTTRTAKLNPMAGNLVQRIVAGNLPNAAPSGGDGGIGDDDSDNTGGLQVDVQIGGGSGGNFVSAIVASGVNLRTGPSGKNSQVIRSLPAGTPIQVLCDRSWCRLASGGFVAKSFLSFGRLTALSPQAGVTAPASTPLGSAGGAKNFLGAWSVLSALLNHPFSDPIQMVLVQTSSSLQGVLGGGTVLGTPAADGLHVVVKTAAADTLEGTLILSQSGTKFDGILFLHGAPFMTLKGTRVVE